MTEKRFVKGYHTIRDTNENKTYDFRVDIICDLLNELDGKWVGEFSLRETLQQELQRVEEENEQLKQFKEDVFNKIDMHLRMLPVARDNEFNEEDGDPTLYTGAIYMLETLKKELKE